MSFMPHHLGPPPRRPPGGVMSMPQGMPPMQQAPGMPQPQGGMMVGGPGGPVQTLMQQQVPVGMMQGGPQQMPPNGFPPQGGLPPGMMAVRQQGPPLPGPGGMPGTYPPNSGPPQPMQTGMGGPPGPPPQGFHPPQQQQMQVQQQMPMQQPPQTGSWGPGPGGPPSRPPQGGPPPPQHLQNGGFPASQQLYSSTSMPLQPFQQQPQQQPPQQPQSWNGSQPMAQQPRKTNGPPSPSLLSNAYKKPMVRFDDSPPEQIPTRSSFRGVPSHNPSLYASTDRVYSEKQLSSSLYASADGVLENRSGLSTSFHQQSAPFNATANPNSLGSGTSRFNLANTTNTAPLIPINNERSTMRSEADKIAERLLKTEEELDRLRKQGQLIGESLRRQKMIEDSSPTKPRVGADGFNEGYRAITAPLPPSSTGSSSFSSTSQLGTFGAAPSITSSGGSKSVTFNTTPLPEPAPRSPKLNAMTPSLPKPATKQATQQQDSLGKTTLSDQECGMLGLPPGTLWFDPSNEAQMQIINDQVAASQQQKANPAQHQPQPPHPGASVHPAGAGATSVGATAPNVPRSSSKRVTVPPVTSLRDDEIAEHFEALNLARDTATVADVVRAYKRIAPRLVENLDDLSKYTVSFKVCEAYLGSGDAGSTTLQEYDPLVVYHGVVYTGKKHAELKVELGVSIQDLIEGHLATFEFDRMVCVEGGGERQPERCQLQINVTPGMRGGTQFIFECEGDEQPGIIPSDVCVTLVLEPHTRFVVAGDDLGTEVHISVADALSGTPLTILTVDSRLLSLQPPKGTVLGPESVFKCPGEGLPLPHDPSQRGSLFVKVHVHFPESLPLTVDQLTTLKSLLVRAPVPLPLSPHDSAAQKMQRGVSSAMIVRSVESEFGASDPDDAPMLCAQQ